MDGNGVNFVIGGSTTVTCNNAAQVFCVGAGYSNVTLTAPTSGPNAGFLVIGPTSASNTAGATFTAGATDNSLSGVFYMPNGAVRSAAGPASATGRPVPGTDRVPGHPQRRDGARQHLHGRGPDRGIDCGAGAMSLKRRLAGLGRDERGVSAVEFALVSPVLILILAGAVDLGGAIYTKFQLDCAVNAAIDYAMVNASSVNSTAGPALASTMAALVSNAQGPSAANASITVNGGPTSTTGGSSAGAGGAASAANSCYCPSGPPRPWTGARLDLRRVLQRGRLAGKFVLVQASTAYAPIFSGFGFMNSGQITSSSIVRVQ